MQTIYRDLRFQTDINSFLLNLFLFKSKNLNKKLDITLMILLSLKIPNWKIQRQ